MTSRTTSADPSDMPRLVGDRPIGSSGEDRFGRDRLARRIAADALTGPDDGGFVIALCGPWGSGKTSLANLAIQEVVGRDPDATIVRFNPWLFSGTTDLVATFFSELGATLGTHDGLPRALLRRAAQYGEYVSNLVRLAPGAGQAAALGIDVATAKARESVDVPPLGRQREALEVELHEWNHRIIVVIDDLDRLSNAEIREVVRLVKLVGDLPKLTYLLAFDRQRVEQALGELESRSGEAADRGRAYLEKIVQVRHDVPPPRTQELARLFDEHINTVIAPYDRKVHLEDWYAIAGSGLLDMIRTPRDVKRIANAASAALEIHGDEVAVVDLLALEALRVLEPGVHASLPNLSDILVEGRSASFFNDEERAERDRQRIDELLAQARDQEAVKTVLGQLFPDASNAFPTRGRNDPDGERRDRRIGTKEVFWTYIHASLDDEALASAEVRRLVDLLDAPDALAAQIEPLSDTALPDLIDRLHDYRDAFQPDKAAVLAEFFTALEPRLPPDRSPFITMRMPASWALLRLVQAFLLSEPDVDRRTDLVRDLVEGTSPLSVRWRILYWFGTFPQRESRDTDREMIDADTTEALVNGLGLEVRTVDPDVLAGEFHVGWLLRLLAESGDDDDRQALVRLMADDAIALALLADWVTVVTTHGTSGAPVQRPVLAWRRLCGLFGEDPLRRRIEELDGVTDRETLTESQRAALDQAAQIVRGELEPDPDF